MAGQSRDRRARCARKNRALLTKAGVDESVATAAAAHPATDGLKPCGDRCTDRSSCSWRYCTAEQLEELLLNHLDSVYHEVLRRLVEMGHEEAVSRRALLCSGHFTGSPDEPSSILEKAVAFLSSPAAPIGGDGACAGFNDLRSLEEYSLAGLVFLLQQHRPSLHRGDALWLLLMSNLRLDRAKSMGLPSANQKPIVDSNDSSANSSCAMCQLHAAGHHPAASSFLPWLKSPVLPTPKSEDDCDHDHGPVAKPVARKIQIQSDVAEVVIKELESLNLEENDEQMERIYDLARQVKALEVQVKERIEWAQQKAIQAAKKVGNDLTELRVLRMERDINVRLKMDKQALEEETNKRLSELDGALKKVSGQVDRANAVVRRLEMDNAEMRAEIQASKLSASESGKTCHELMKREKKSGKKVQACQKQVQKIQEDIDQIKAKTFQTEREINKVKRSTREIEVKLREEIKAKEQAVAQANEEREAKETAKVNAQRRLESLRMKVEMDSRLLKDDLGRLEDEFLRLQRVSGAAAHPELLPPAATTPDVADATQVRKQDIGKTLKGAATKVQKSNQRRRQLHRECVACKKMEACVLLLPCAHEVLCISCNSDHESKGKPSCPCCKTHIDERIRVYGMSN